MERRLDHYLERLVSPDSMTFYKALCDFADERTMTLDGKKIADADDSVEGIGAKNYQEYFRPLLYSTKSI